MFFMSLITYLGILPNSLSLSDCLETDSIGNPLILYPAYSIIPIEAHDLPRHLL